MNNNKKYQKNNKKLFFNKKMFNKILDYYLFNIKKFNIK